MGLPVRSYQQQSWGKDQRGRCLPSELCVHSRYPLHDHWNTRYNFHNFLIFMIYCSWNTFLWKYPYTFHFHYLMWLHVHGCGSWTQSPLKVLWYKSQGMKLVSTDERTRHQRARSMVLNWNILKTFADIKALLSIEILGAYFDHVSALTSKLSLWKDGNMNIVKIK